MFRALVFAAVVAALSGCGPEADEQPPPPPVAVDVEPSYYSQWLGPWKGEVHGQTDRGVKIAFQGTATLVSRNAHLVLDGVCGTDALKSYFLGKERAFFKVDRKVQCTIPTPCGTATLDLSSASLSPYSETQVLVFILMSGEVCGEPRQLVTLSAGMTR